MTRPAPSADRAADSYAFRVHGLDCAEEVAVLRRAVAPLVGGEERLAFDVLRGRMTVLARPSEVPPEAVRRAVARTGMRAEPWRAEGETPAGGARSLWRRRGRDLLAAASALLTVAGYVVHAVSAASAVAALTGEGAGGDVPLLARLLYLGAVVTGLWFVAPKALHAARRLRPDMHLLMTVAIAGALGLGEWLEAASVAFLFALSQVLEAWSVGRARKAVGALLDLSPSVARVREADGAERTLTAAEVPVGAHLVVKPGEKVPLDGEVLAGRSEVDQAPITGESAPVPKEPGDEVFAGTINGTGALEVRSTRPAGETTLARIIRLVERAQARRSPSERWVDRFARVYTPVVMALAALVLVVPPLLLGGSWEVWLYRALVLLVIGCPCALVISTPVSVVAALASSARHGVLLKGGAFVELPAGLRALAFDKTGTLTEGEPRVAAVVPLDGSTEADLLALAAALEARSGHPVARAVVEHARDRGVAVVPAADVRAIPGRGVTGTVAGRRCWLGSHRFLVDRGQATPAVDRRLGELSAAGRTAVVVGDDEGVRGLIAVADRLRPEAREAVAALRRRGIAHLVMLTGDNRPTAEAIAAEAGIDEVRSELLPEDKVAAVEELVARVHREGGRVAMVGDGVNDAPAMARADLGIAMGAAGSDAAIETADVALMADDLARLPWLVGHSRRALSIIRQNVIFALAVKLAVFLLATIGYATLWAAIAADMGASLAVIFNALRLLRA